MIWMKISQANTPNHVYSSSFSEPQLGTHPRRGVGCQVTLGSRYHAVPLLSQYSTGTKTSPSITMLHRIYLQVCVHISLVEWWASKEITIGIKVHGVVFIAHIWISSFTDCSFPIPVVPVSQHNLVAMLWQEVTNLQHVIPIIVDPEVVELPVKHLKHNLSSHDKSTVKWPNVSE